jgi:hypothetical protein
MSEKKSGRLSKLAELFGVAKVDDNIHSLAAALEEAGLPRKKEWTDKQKGIMETLHADVSKIIAKLTDEEKPELVNEILAITMAKLANLDEPVEELPTEEEPVETLQEGEEEEEDEEVPEAFMELKDELFAVAKDAAETQRDMAELLPQLVDVVKAVRPVLPVLDEVGDLVERMKAMEEKFKMRPRASIADDTLVTDADVEAALKERAKTGTRVLGLRVTEE